VSLRPYISVELVSLRVFTSRQGNNEEQAHTKNKGPNEHDWKNNSNLLENKY
jgi:hypothetical protein